jgi:hypothetical protein
LKAIHNKEMNRFQETKRLFPNIEWLRTRSATPREVHLAYVGRVWPMDDPFFKLIIRAACGAVNAIGETLISLQLITRI